MSKLQIMQKQTQDMVRQICEHINVNNKVDTLSVVDSMRIGMQSRAGRFSRLDSKIDWNLTSEMDLKLP